MKILCLSGSTPPYSLLNSNFSLQEEGHVLCYIRPGQQSKQTPGQFLYRSLQEQVTGAQEHTGQARQLGNWGNHLQHDKMLWMLQTTAICDFLRVIRNMTSKAATNDYVIIN